MTEAEISAVLACILEGAQRWPRSDTIKESAVAAALIFIVTVCREDGISIEEAHRLLDTTWARAAEADAEAPA